MNTEPWGIPFTAEPGAAQFYFPPLAAGYAERLRNKMEQLCCNSKQRSNNVFVVKKPQ